MSDNVTKHDIIAAADVLASRGEMPGARNVREALGNRGSMATINKYVQQWKDDLLTKASSGCFFCETNESKRLELSERADKLSKALEQAKESVMAMLHSEDRHVAAQQIIRMLQ